MLHNKRNSCSETRTMLGKDNKYEKKNIEVIVTYSTLLSLKGKALAIVFFKIFFIFILLLDMVVSSSKRKKTDFGT